VLLHQPPDAYPPQALKARPPTPPGVGTNSQVSLILDAVLYSDLQQAEEGLRRSESYLSEAQRLSHTGSFGWRTSSGEIYWSEETFRIIEYHRATTPTGELLMGQRVHPEDVATWQQLVERAAHEGQDFAHQYRLRMPDGRVKHLHVVAHAIRTETGEVDFVGAVKDVTEQKWAQAERERLEQRLRQAAKLPQGSWRAAVMASETTCGDLEAISIVAGPEPGCAGSFAPREAIRRWRARVSFRRNGMDASHPQGFPCSAGVELNAT
jgi:hypothetical protein